MEGSNVPTEYFMEHYCKSTMHDGEESVLGFFVEKRKIFFKVVQKICFKILACIDQLTKKDEGSRHISRLN